MKTKTKKTEEETTLRTFLALAMADIDIFLLKDETQENDKDKLYTKEEIREQLMSTMQKFTNLPMISEAIYDVPLFPSLGQTLLENAGFSKSEIKRYQKLAD